MFLEVVDITPASEPARAASEPPPSAVAPSKSNSMFDEPAVDLAASTQSIRSQAAPVPSTTGDVAGANQEMGSPRRR
ncbi:uncharacterized protein PHACADRAFT_253684 [Phanerochaete carnosa HHB-10118-sp]|uniref:Uncharacterized protein n=1 Tax=Phanerochaete carnosa (strain HHB-10118-sp) TaxID=650164 RepID=K5WBD5_PHACS|nr:uncharacterized protein PHACADRAFT_253684 [Phanerochaete carnosa HHB-10118-sp]EKM56515.1 hypothetical protein PHACADRAFT_253684 [Phanerochaete carnosa HHB-10118-sp]